MGSDPGTDRTWTLARVAVGRSKGGWNVREGTDLSEFGPTGIGEWTDFVSVVEESRLREAEAERDKVDAAFKRWREDARRIQAAAEGEKLQAEARVERLEAELREARAIIRDFCEYSLPAPPSVVSLQALTDRARGVLEKGHRGRPNATPEPRNA